MIAALFVSFVILWSATALLCALRYSISRSERKGSTLSTTDIMLDIETLGVRPGFVVLSAAFVRFSDLASCSLVLDTAEQATLGLEIDPQTQEWWLGQSAEARKAAFMNPVPLRPALEYFATWLAWAAPNGATIWCHGASFDAPILQEVYRRTGVPCPWAFRNVRCTRTLYDLAGLELVGGAAHVALDDAMAQTHLAVKALGALVWDASRTYGAVGGGIEVLNGRRWDA